MKVETRELAGNFIFTVDAFRMTKNGGAKITLTIPENQVPKAVAIAMQTDAVFEADLFLVPNETFGANSA